MVGSACLVARKSKQDEHYMIHQQKQKWQVRSLHVKLNTMSAQYRPTPPTPVRPSVPSPRPRPTTPHRPPQDRRTEGHGQGQAPVTLSHTHTRTTLALTRHHTTPAWSRPTADRFPAQGQRRTEVSWTGRESSPDTKHHSHETNNTYRCLSAVWVDLAAGQSYCPALRPRLVSVLAPLLAPLLAPPLPPASW